MHKINKDKIQFAIGDSIMVEAYKRNGLKKPYLKAFITNVDVVGYNITYYTDVVSYAYTNKNSGFSNFYGCKLLLVEKNQICYEKRR